MKALTRLKLFTPVRLGALGLSHRVVMAPLTRSRSEQPGDIPGDLMVEYYTQRASEGGLIISEATSISISGPWLEGSARALLGPAGRRLEACGRCGARQSAGCFHNCGTWADLPTWR